MSTVPGPESFDDAGLEPVEPDEPRRLTDEVAPEGDPEEYRPGFARADRDDEAAEADVIEQDTEVPHDDESEDA